MLFPPSSHSTPEGTLKKTVRSREGNSRSNPWFCRFFFFFWSSVCLHWAFTAACGLSLGVVSRGSSCCSVITVYELLIAVASLFAEHRLQGAWALVFVPCGFSSGDLRALEHRLSSCGSGAQLLPSMWDLLRPGMELVFLALAGRCLSTCHQGSPGFAALKVLLSVSSGAFLEITQSLIQNSKPKLSSF